MPDTETVGSIMKRVELKLDLIFELVEAKKIKDWKQVKEVCRKMDSMKL